MDNAILIQGLVGLVLFAAGLGIGRATSGGDAKARARVEELESELAATRKDLEGYRAQVEKHFEKTSQIFRDLTDQYSALYGHLAEGARSLCPDGGPALGLGLNDPLLDTGDLLDEESPLGDLESETPSTESAPSETGSTESESTEASAEPAAEQAEAAEEAPKTTPETQAGSAAEPEPEAKSKPVAASSKRDRTPLQWEDLVDEKSAAAPDGDDAEREAPRA